MTFKRIAYLRGNLTFKKQIKMKKYLFVLIVAIVAFSCTKNAGYKINVNLEGAKGTIVLEQYKSGEMLVKDSAVVTDGKALLQGKVKLPEIYLLSIKGDMKKLRLFVENAEITVTGKADSISIAKVSGSVTHDEYQSVTDKITKLSEEYMKIFKEAREASAAGDTAKGNGLMKKVEEIYKGVGTIQEDFIKSNPASYATPFFLAQIQYEKNEDELETLLKGLDPKLDSVETIVTLKGHLAKMKNVAVGQVAPDFTQNDPNGNPIKLSDVYSKNEITLIDFWASWCGPCRAENPNVVAVFKEFGSKGFGVFGVSLDKDKDKWLEAIETDQLTWPHVSDLKYWKNEASQLYAINSIPSNILVDKQGKIIGKNLRGGDLKNKVAEMLNK